jgi:hypothetical protein
MVAKPATNIAYSDAMYKTKLLVKTKTNNPIANILKSILKPVLKLAFKLCLRAFKGFLHLKQTSAFLLTLVLQCGHRIVDTNVTPLKLILSHIYRIKSAFFIN